MALESPIPGGLLESLSKLLGDNLSHIDIERSLAESKIVDIAPLMARQKRIYNAFANHQNNNHRSNEIQTFIQKAFSPLRFTENHEQFDLLRTKVNTCLLLIGIELQPTGKYRRVEKAATIVDAQKRSDLLKQKLKDRKVHQDVLLFCKAELLQDNYFHAVFEATKSVADKIRVKSGLTLYGSELVDRVFTIGQSRTPKLFFTALQNESEESEHKRFMNLVKGLFGMFRNTTAHAPRIQWVIDEEDALDSLTLASLIHRKLDKCIRDRVL